MDSNFKEPAISYGILNVTSSLNSSSIEPAISYGSPNITNSSSGAASNTFSPAVIAIIVILGAAFLLVTCYTIMAKFGTPWEVFQRRRWRRQVAGATVDDDDNNPAAVTWPLMEAQQGLEEAVIQAIPVFDYRKKDGQLTVAREGAEGGGSDCAVCLSEFEEGERVRMLPKCSHAFHLPCIDMWLRSHSNCPLCRANITSPAPAPDHQPPPHATDISPQPSPTIDDDDAALQDPGHHQLHIIDENTQGDEADALDSPLTRLRPLNREHKTIPLISRQPHDHHATDADQVFERASLQLGSGFRCFSTGRASLSFRCFSTDRASPSFGHESERLADLDAADSSTVNPRMTRSSSLGFCMDNIIHVHTDNYSYHTREGDHRRVIDLNHHEKVVLVDTVHNINSRLEESSSSNAGGGSSSTSEGMRDFKSKSLNLDDSELKSLKADQSIEDPLMGRMVLSLKGPRAVKRSFSGGRLFGFKVQKNSTAVSVGTSTEAASRLPI